MSKIEELIEHLCPDGVEWKTLNNISINFDSKRKPVRSTDRQSGKYPYYGASGIVDYVSDYIFDGDFLLVSEDGANLIARNTSIAFSISGKTWVNNHAHILKFDNYATKRLVEIYLNSIDLTKYISGAAQPKLNQENLNKIPIPIPPLAIQQEIVNILDKFTQLQAELEAELEARRKQYEYYRNELLNFEGKDVEWKTLGEVCRIQSGGTPLRNRPEYWDEGTIKWLGSTVCKNRKTVDEITSYITEIGLKNSSARLFKAESTLIALVGATIGKVAFLPYPATTNQNIAGIYPLDTNKLNTSFLYYSCRALYAVFTNLSQDKLKMANLSFVRGLKIPIPPIAEQERIAAILDKFESLVNDQSFGLPAEIEARRKQYEYYRGKLLDFNRREA